MKQCFIISFFFHATQSGLSTPKVTKKEKLGKIRRFDKLVISSVLRYVAVSQELYTIQFSDWWLDMAYLGYRAPLPVWSSPGIIMPPQDFSDSDEKWLSFTARLVEAVLDYKRKIDNDLVKVDMSGSLPMDMVHVFSHLIDYK